MKTVKKIAVAMATAGALALGLSTPAHAINEVDCGDRTDFLLVRLPSSDHCFANAGPIGVDLRDPVLIWGGNNDAIINYVDRVGRGDSIRVNRGQLLRRVDGSLPDIPRIYEIRIL
ncbi:hypothetical protein AB0K60_31235 [Thermopolyspora sp. NPDC052614]|uniref:hypothetical protein n=1 Tax=Thermopolyspora sp. NPDC052614 TaxID=3155682 RepID=UPI0034444105